MVEVQVTQTGVYVGNDPAAFAAYSKWVGSTPGNVLNYLNNDSWSAFDSSIGYEVSLWKNTAASNIWSVPLTVWGTSLEQVATGSFNDHFLKAAQGLVQTQTSSDGNIYVRVGWEFNGSWMPWAANGHEDAFIKAFQELVTTFRSVSNKFKFVWDTTNDGGNMNPEKAYPGDKYVDVIGTDVYYDTQWDGMDAAKGFKGEVTRTYGLQWQQDFAAAHGKATAISEWGVASDNAGPYVQAMTKWMADHNMVYENYWDSNASYSGKLSTGANATAGAAYKSAVSSLQGAATSLPLTAPSVAITSPGGLTNSLAVKLSGTAGLSDVGTTVHVLDGVTEIGTAIVQADGKWNTAVTLLNQQGTHQITASDANAAGTGKSSIVSYTVDTVAPLLSVSESVSGLTNKTSNIVTVTGSDSTSGMRSVEIYDNGRDLGAATQSSKGSWVFTAPKLTDGTHNFTAVAIDNAGNKSGPVSAGKSVVVDTLAPVVKLGLVQDTGTSSTDKITTNPALTGTAEAGAKVTLSEGTTTLGLVTADSTGHWNFTPTSLKVGAHIILASQTDAAGNTGADTFTFNLQNAPSVAITSPGGLTNSLAVKLSGTAGLSDVGTTVHVLDGVTEIGTAIVQADGKWNTAVTLLNQQGTHQITASDANAAGTGKSSIVSYTVDTVAPLLSVSESVSGLTNKTSNIVTVTGSDSTSGMRSVEIYDNGRDLGAATQSSKGSWVFTAPKLTDGTHNFTAVAIDNAGNKSGPVSAGKSVVVDTLAPVVKLGLVQDTGTSSTDKITTNPALTGTAEAGAKVTLSEGTTTLGLVTADSTGHWNFTPTSLKVGAHTILASQTDAAGNTGSDSFVFDLVKTPLASTSTPPSTVQSDTLVFKVSGDSWQGDPHFIVTVDGKQVGGTLTTSASHAAGQTQDITLTGNFGSGAHDVAVKFIDDAYGWSADKDRNLYVHQVTLDGEVHAGSMTAGSNGVAGLMSTGSTDVVHMSGNSDWHM